MSNLHWSSQYPGWQIVVVVVVVVEVIDRRRVSCIKHAYRSSQRASQSVTHATMSKGGRTNERVEGRKEGRKEGHEMNPMLAEKEREESKGSGRDGGGGVDDM